MSHDYRCHLYDLDTPLQNLTLVASVPGVLADEDVGGLVEVDRLGLDDPLEDVADLRIPEEQNFDSYKNNGARSGTAVELSPPTRTSRV